MLSRRELLRAVGLTASGLAAAPVLSACGTDPRTAADPLPSDAAGAGGAAQVALSRVPRSPVDAAARADGVAVIQAFSADLYRQLAAAPGNVVSSPFSVAVALAMTRNGARGETATEMDAVLHAPPLTRLNGGLNAVQQRIESLGGRQRRLDGSSATLELDVANSLWGQAGVDWLSGFLDTLAAEYGAGMRLVDFIGNAEGARTAINAWTAERTHDRIPDLLPDGVLDVLTRLVLVNAVYLKAAWEIPFASELTRPMPFIRRDGTTAMAPTMQGIRLAGYAAGSGWQAVDLPYVGSQLAMAVVLPADGPDGLAVLDAPDQQSLQQLLTTFEPTEVRIDLPRWTFRTQASLGDALAALGMPTAFTDRADFSGMTTDAKLAINAVIHEAFVSVDEDGTEAAAATAVVVGETSAGPEPLAVAVDRPFLFVIHDVETATPLFIGRVEDPTA